MAVATENSTRHMVSTGNVAEEIVDITWTNGDTFASEFAAIFGWTFTPTTSASFGITASGTTLTLVSSGSLTGKLAVKSSGA